MLAYFLPSRFSRLACSGFTLLAISIFGSSIAQAQYGSRDNTGGSGGNHTIQGRVYLPNGRPAEAGIRVHLESSESLPASSVTDNDGGFSFRGLTAGDYRIVIQGTKDYETSVESADIYRESSPGGVNKMVNIQLRAKPGGALDPLSDVPQAARERYLSAQEASKKNDTAKAVEELTAALAIKPDFKAALNELGMQYLKLNQPEKASEMFKRAVKLAPEEYTPKVNYGLALYSQRKFEDAQIELLQAVKMNKALPSAHLYLGMTYVGLKKFDEAQKEFEIAISSGGDSLGQAHRYLGGLYARAGKHKQAAIELEKYLKLTPNAPDAVQAQAMIKDLRSKQ